MKLLGITDQFNTCDCCGKTDLKCTVAFQQEDGSIVYYGRICATRWYSKPQKEINKELKSIREQANKKANELWRIDPLRKEMEDLLIRLNNGPKISFEDRMNQVRPLSLLQGIQRTQICKEISSEFMLSTQDIFLRP